MFVRQIGFGCKLHEFEIHELTATNAYSLQKMSSMVSHMEDI